MKLTYCVLILAAAMIAGCCGRSDEPGTTEGQPQDAAKSPAQQPPPPAPVANKPAPETVRKPAVAGVGKKGRDYGAGPVATPIATYFSIRQRIAFLQIVTPMNMYRVEHGHFPKTQEEFMEQIIKKNSIKLPELPARERYVYDPEKAAETNTYDANNPPLMVERMR